MVYYVLNRGNARMPIFEFDVITRRWSEFSSRQSIATAPTYWPGG